MADKFDPLNYPGKVPQKLIVGDFWGWKREDIVGDYPTGSHTLTYSFRLLSSAATEITLGSSQIAESATAYTVTVPSSTTDDYTKGDYIWQEYISNSSNRVVINEGYVTLESNLDADATDPRSFWNKVLDATNAMLENRASIDQSSMSIAGRSLSRMPISELFLLRDRAQYQTNKEKNKARIAKGLGSSSIIKARF